MTRGVAFRSVAVVAATGLLLALTGINGLAAGDSRSGSFQYLVATDFLCGIGPTACPAVAIAENGDRVEFSGSGTFSLPAKSATGGGIFTHKNSIGTVLGSGTWTATSLLSFESFGPSPGFPANFVGGHALIRVELHTASGATLTGIVTILCVLGNVPGDKTEDVNLLNIQDVINFNKVIPGGPIASGANVFIHL